MLPSDCPGCRGWSDLGCPPSALIVSGQSIHLSSSCLHLLWKRSILSLSLQALKIPVIISENIKEALQSQTDNVEIIFVCEPFEGENFELLRKEEQRIIGPPIVRACAREDQPLPYNSRPLYCTIMCNHIVCFTGFRKKEELGRLCNLVHHMGGSIRREFSGRVTQLVANSIHGQKYRVSIISVTVVISWVTNNSLILAGNKYII